ncbi:MAG: 4-(cytidine 5'-diphospho)-2-C-methyl-D-erythritol kinase [Dissulfurimicrobium sp.]|uniref:4-(cytidine 5'-diphospho)-2-C-methyl-D-erythritol kinase n=1 Tax=Dissulfurimicrobium sp. TaxID=2022436 RepID=UPI00404B3755
MDSLNLKTPAKINLFLHITGQRDDGYHNIITVFQKINLWDEITLTISKEKKEICLECYGDNLPGGEANIAFKATKIFMDRTGIKCGVKIKLNKLIPIGAGLGGGSSDAAAVLKGLNSLTGNLLNDDDMNNLACQLGADVPFFMSDAAAAIGTGTGTELEAIDTPQRFYLLVWPGFSISTKWVYEHFKLTSQPYDTIFDAKQVFRTRLWVNDLEKVVAYQYPQIEAIKKRLMDLGAEASMMSGSGSTVFGVFASRHEAEAAALGLRLSGNQRSYLVEGLR